MKDGNGENKGNKRARDDSGFCSPYFNRVDSGASSPVSKKARNYSHEHNVLDLVRVDLDEPGIDSCDSTWIPNDILDILDDESGTAADVDPASQDLESVMKSFEEEILHPSRLQPPPEIMVASSGPAGSLPDFGYLLEASDDELGLPPTVSQAGAQTEANAEPADLVVSEEAQMNDGGFAPVEGLFEIDLADISELLRRSETLRAL